MNPCVGQHLAIADDPRLGLGPNEEVVQRWSGVRRVDGARGEPLEIRLTNRQRLLVATAADPPEIVYAAGPPYRARLETVDDDGADVLVRIAVPKVPPLELWIEGGALAPLLAWSAGRRPAPGTGRTADSVQRVAGEDRVRIEFQHHEGPHDDEEHWVPRLVDVRTGEVIISFWDSRFGGPIELERPGAVRLLLGDYLSALYLEVDIDQRVIRVLSDQVLLERRDFVDDVLWASPYRIEGPKR